jgi:hypothetical protein
MQPAEIGDALGAGAQHQVIGIGEDHREARRGDVARLHRLDGRGGADRHEGRGFHLAMRGDEFSAPRLAVLRRHGESEAHAACSGWSRQASP